MKKTAAIVGMIYSENLGDGVIYDCVAHLLQREDYLATPCDIAGRLGYASGGVGEKLRGSGKLKRLLASKYAVATFVNRARWLPKRTAYMGFLKDRLENADFVLIGGGQLITDIYFGLPLRYKSIQKVLDKKEIPYSIAFCGVGNKFSSGGRKVYQNLLGRANSVLVRGDDSLARVNALVPHIKKSVAVPDPAFICSKVYNFSTNRSKSTVGLCYQSVSSLALHSKFYKGIGVSGLNDALLFLIRTLLEGGFNVELFTNGDREDFFAVSELYNNNFKGVPNVTLADRPLRPAELVKLIAGYAKTISFRMHASIISYGLGIPTVNLVWDDKIRDVWALVDEPNIPVDLEMLLNGKVDILRVLREVELSEEKLGRIIKEIESEFKLFIDGVQG